MATILIAALQQKYAFRGDILRRLDKVINI